MIYEQSGLFGTELEIPDAQEVTNSVDTVVKTDSFVNDLIISMSGDKTPAAYSERMQLMIKNLDALEVPMKIKTEADYQVAYKIKGELCSLSCYTFNNNLPQDKRVWELESIWGKALTKFNNKLHLKSSEDIVLANYLLSNRRYKIIDHSKLVGYAKKRGFLRIVNGKIAVVGLVKKVRDNVTRLDRRGREYSLFVNTIGRQYFMIELFKDDVFQNDPSLLDGIPVIENGYYDSGFGFGKGSSKRPPIKKETLSVLMGILKTC
jgi:hypothetical protein